MINNDQSPNLRLGSFDFHLNYVMSIKPRSIDRTDIKFTGWDIVQSNVDNHRETFSDQVKIVSCL